MRRRVVRTACRVGVLLFVGAVVNVGVAWWGSAISSRTPITDESFAGSHCGDWPFPVPRGYPKPDELWRIRFGSFKMEIWEYEGPLLLAREGAEPSSRCVSSCSHIRARSGYPCWALEWQRRRESVWHGTQHRSIDIDRGEVSLPTWCCELASFVKRGEVNNWSVLTIPVWPGFAVNTAVYASLAWAPLGAWRLGRARLRRRRGACVACGYDVRGLQACPECGR